MAVKIVTDSVTDVPSQVVKELDITIIPILIRWDVQAAARAIRREKLFAPTPGPWCRGCDFAVICPKGVEVTGQSEAERQLELWRDFWVETQGSVQVEVNTARTGGSDSQLFHLHNLAATK